jgi:glucosamine-6-phosphate deaminase
MIKLIVCKDYEEASDKAAEIVLDVVKKKPDCTLGLATGSSPVGLYQRMIRDHEENGTSYKDVKSYNLDEYVGLEVSHPESYYSFMHRNLFDHIDIKEENVHLPSSQGDDLQKNCDLYNAALAQTQVDLQVLGIGSNGHIGFNEPFTPFDSVTHIVDLKQSTINDNARFFDNDVSKVPTQAITMGISNVMAARKIVLIASGANKVDAIYKTICGPVSEEVPASVLQQHPDVTVIVDEAAASLLPKEKVKVEILNTEVFDDVVREGTVLVDFFANWCGPCKMLSPVLEQLAQQYAGKIRFYKVDCDADQGLAQRFGVTSIPNVVILKDGQLFDRSIGYASKDQLVAFLENAL